MVTEPQRKLFDEINIHLMGDEKPSEYLNSIVEPIFLFKPFSVINDLKNIPQSPKHHPEGVVWNHILMVVDQAAARKYGATDSQSFMWAALLHDIGKTPTTKERSGRLTSYDHDKVGADMTSEFLHCFSENEGFISRTTKLVRWHMQLLYVEKNLPFADLKAMTEELGVQDIALFCLCDRLGRVGADVQKEENSVKVFVEKAQQYQLIAN